jgi:hypothetical protein
MWPPLLLLLARALAWLAVALGASLAWHAAAPVARWRLRHLPGPRGAWPLLGHLPQMARRGRGACLDAWAAQHGGIFKARARAARADAQPRCDEAAS